MTKLPSILVLISLLAAVHSQISSEDIPVILRYHQQCKAETNVNESLVVGTIAGHFPDDRLLKQHFFCMSKKFGMQNEAGEIQTDVVKTHLAKIVQDPEKIDEIVKKCSNQEEDPAETAMQMAKCTYQSLHNNK